MQSAATRLLSAARPTTNGLSHLRLRSTAGAVDTAGFPVDSVRVDIDDPITPPCTSEQNRAFEAEHIRLIEGRRDKTTKPVDERE